MIKPLFTIALREADDDEDPIVQEAATAKARALAAARALDDIIDARDVSDEIKQGAKGFRALLRSKWADLKGVATPATKATEAAIDYDTFESIPLTEAAPGEFNIRVIGPGWGSSGYYPPETLQRAAADRIFPSGTKMYWNHPTKTEERERPERDLRDLAGTLQEDARWLENGPSGAGLYARIKTVGHYSNHVKELAPHIGVSIRGTGTGKDGEVAGRRGKVIEAITGAKSVDFVTAPGAGGKVLELFEAARENTEDDMDLKEAEAKLTEATNKLTEAAAEMTKLREEKAKSDAELARLRTGQLVVEAQRVADAHMKAVRLPDAAKARLAEAVVGNPPEKDGKLDESAFKTQLDEAIKAETEYIEKLTGRKVVEGMGGSSWGEGGGATLEETNKALDAVFADIGLSEAERKIAVAGR